jgi:glycosyltransferase involved in cell wall biosynthesis
MMAARPIVSTSVGGIPEVLEDGSDGVLVPPGDEQALAEAILALAADRDRRRALGLKAREKAIARYSARAVLETLEASYVSILDAKGQQWSRHRHPAAGTGTGAASR